MPDGKKRERSELERRVIEHVAKVITQRIRKKMAQERAEEFEAMLKRPRGSSDGKPARPPKSQRPRCDARTRVAGQDRLNRQN